MWHKSRIKKLREAMIKKEVEGVMLYNPMNIPWNSSMYYFLRKSKNYEPYAILITLDKEIEVFGDLTIKINEKNKNKIKNLSKYIKEEGINKLGLENPPINTISKFKKEKIEVVDIKKEILTIRMIKDNTEIREMKKAGKKTREIFEDIRDKVWDKKEIDIFKYIKIKCIEEGDCAFEPIVAGEKNSREVHHYPNNTKISKHLLLDFGFKKEYCSDFSITLTKNEKIQEKWDILKSIFIDITESIKVGDKLKEIDENMKHRLQEKFNKKEIYSNFHLLGHGVGIEVHELPSFSSNQEIRKGMVIAIEPAIYTNKWGMRIEDTFIVKKRKIEPIVGIHHRR